MADWFMSSNTVFPHVKQHMLICSCLVTLCAFPQVTDGLFMTVIYTMVDSGMTSFHMCNHPIIYVSFSTYTQQLG